ncbi:hypothetical protein MA16_Dca024177 [Dendrobium catenatum]|uniref:Uncharacterized protein n=1 Tax=Dendrobium catenatum TaxID=906689 RepID=A0A2I0VZ60_9ASPA|nr:hypothetical protein MA16_Dca024177 [Dendrobium catenatum]
MIVLADFQKYRIPKLIMEANYFCIEHIILIDIARLRGAQRLAIVSSFRKDIIIEERAEKEQGRRGYGQKMEFPLDDIEECEQIDVFQNVEEGLQQRSCRYPFLVLSISALWYRAVLRGSISHEKIYQGDLLPTLMEFEQLKGSLPTLGECEQPKGSRPILGECE